MMPRPRNVIKTKEVTVKDGVVSSQHVSVSGFGGPGVQVVQSSFPQNSITAPGVCITPGSVTVNPFQSSPPPRAPAPFPSIRVNPMIPVRPAPLPWRAPVRPPMLRHGPPLPSTRFPPPAQESTGSATGCSQSTKQRRTSLGIELPAHWSDMRSTDNMKSELLNPSSDEYDRVCNAFIATGGPKRVKEIKRLQCLGTYQLYTVKRSEVDKALGDTSRFRVEQNLYHGTSPDVLENISQEGFNRSLCGKNATKYGKGTYFAKNASYASNKKFARPDADGYRYVLQCRVITGEYTLGDKSFKLAPENPTSDTTRFHSVVDDIEKPTKFVVFHDAQAYAEYVIKFK